MPDSALLVTIGVAAIAIAIGTWNAAANSDDRAPLLVLLGVAVPSLLAIGAIGSDLLLMALAERFEQLRDAAP